MTYKNTESIYRLNSLCCVLCNVKRGYLAQLQGGGGWRDLEGFCGAGSQRAEAVALLRLPHSHIASDLSLVTTIHQYHEETKEGKTNLPSQTLFKDKTNQGIPITPDH